MQYINDLLKDIYGKGNYEKIKPYIKINHPKKKKIDFMVQGEDIGDAEQTEITAKTQAIKQQQEKEAADKLIQQAVEHEEQAASEQRSKIIAQREATDEQKKQQIQLLKTPIMLPRQKLNFEKQRITQQIKTLNNELQHELKFTRDMPIDKIEEMSKLKQKKQEIVNKLKSMPKKRTEQLVTTKPKKKTSEEAILPNIQKEQQQKEQTPISSISLLTSQQYLSLSNPEKIKKITTEITKYNKFKNEAQDKLKNTTNKKKITSYNKQIKTHNKKINILQQELENIKKEESSIIETASPLIIAQKTKQQEPSNNVKILTGKLNKLNEDKFQTEALISTTDQNDNETLTKLNIQLNDIENKIQDTEKKLKQA